MTDIDKVRRRIRELIRLAKDQKGKPEGNNALKMARRLITKHGLEREFIRQEKTPVKNPDFDKNLSNVVQNLKDLFKV